MFFDSTVKKVKYVGITENIYKRLHNHLTCNSNKRDFIKTQNWTSLNYMDCSWFVFDREELLFLENYLINKYNPSENRKLNIIKNVSVERQQEIINDYCRLSKKGFWTKCDKDTFKVS